MRPACRIATFLLPILAASSGRAGGPWCTNTDGLRLEAAPAAGAVSLTHTGAMYNCCPEPILYDVAAAAGVLTVTERVLEESPCDCICCFDLEAIVSDVPPGDWEVVFRWLDAESGSWQELTGSVTVPAPVCADAPHAAPAAPPECLVSTGVEPPAPAGAWGLVKTIYR